MSLVPTCTVSHYSGIISDVTGSYLHCESPFCGDWWISSSVQTAQVELQNSWSMPIIPGTEGCFYFLFFSNISKCRTPVLNLSIKRLHTSVVDDLMSGAIYRTQGYNLSLWTIKQVPLCWLTNELFNDEKEIKLENAECLSRTSDNSEVEQFRSTYQGHCCDRETWTISFHFRALLLIRGSNFYIFLTKIKCPAIILFSMGFKI